MKKQPHAPTTTPIATSSTANAPSASPSVMPEKPAELTPQQRRAVMGDPLFHEFLSRTSFLMERALNVNFDVIMDVGRCLQRMCVCHPASALKRICFHSY